MKPGKLPVQSRLRNCDVVSRAAAAIVGGYAATTAVSILLARLLPMPKANATVTAVLATSSLYVCAIVWAFAARSPLRAWGVLSAVGIVAGTTSWALIALGGR